ncbi:MAG: TetR/AcrR family transcriptional regulator [Polyangia bacterium]
MARKQAAPRRTARPYHHGDLRRTLLDAALAIVGKAGPGALSLRELARKAGVSHAAPYRHFKSREALVLPLANHGFPGLGAEMQRSAGGESNPILRFRALGVAYVSYAVSHPGHFRIMFSNELHEGTEDPELAEAGAPTLEALIETIAAAQDAGQIRAGDPRALAVPAWSMAHGLAMLLVDQQLRALVETVYAETLAHAVIDVAVRGLSPSPSSPPASPSPSSPSASSRRRRSSS